MEAKKNFRSRIMKMAWHIRKTTELAWSECQSQAWAVRHLADKMRRGIVHFAYAKADGTIRNAVGTLMNFPSGKATSGKQPYKTQAYFDVEKQAIRCFKVENLIVAV